MLLALRDLDSLGNLIGNNRIASIDTFVANFGLESGRDSKPRFVGFNLSAFDQNFYFIFFFATK